MSGTWTLFNNCIIIWQMGLKWTGLTNYEHSGIAYLGYRFWFADMAEHFLQFYNQNKQKLQKLKI